MTMVFAAMLPFASVIAVEPPPTNGEGPVDVPPPAPEGIDLSPWSTETHVFRDVAKTDLFAVAMAYLNELDVILGEALPGTTEPSGNYNPANGLTRAQAAVLLFKLDTGRTNITNAQPAEFAYVKDFRMFTDVAADDWYAVFVNYLASRGIVSGIPQDDDTFIFNPNGILTYRDFLVLLVRFIDGALFHQHTDYWNDGYYLRARHGMVHGRGILGFDVVDFTKVSPRFSEVTRNGYHNEILRPGDWAITRDYVAQIIYNALHQGTRHGHGVGNSLNHDIFGVKKN
jgi:hypothetical protein